MAVAVAFAMRLDRAVKAAFGRFFAGFCAFEGVVSAEGFDTGLAGLWALIAELCLTQDASPGWRCVSFVTCFVAGNETVATKIFFARFSRCVAVPPIFPCTVFGTSVFVIGIAVVTFFVSGDDAVAAGTCGADGFVVCLVTDPAGFDVAVR